MQYPYEPYDPYAALDRRSLLGCAGSALGLVALLLIAYTIAVTNPIQRVQLRFIPPHTAVPVSELRSSGPLYRGYPTSAVAASTSLDALRRTVLGGDSCPLCWEDVHAAPGTLLVAAVPFGCGSSHEWYGWTNGSTLTIDLVTWGCP